MTTEINQPPAHSIVDDGWGGLAAMLVALPSSIAFGVLVATSAHPDLAAQGALAGMLGAAVLGLVAPIIGRTGGLISAPCAPAAAILSGLAVGLTAGAGLEPSEALGLLAITALLAAGFQVLFGVVGGGRLIKYIPYPVVSGYLSGVGVLIALGQLPKLLGLAKGVPLGLGIVSPEVWRWQGLVVGLVTMVVMVLAPRLTRKVPAAILALVAGIASYFALSVFSPQLRDLHNNFLVIGSIRMSGSFLDAVADRARSILAIEMDDLGLILVPSLTLAVLLSIDTLKTCVVLDALTHSRHNSNRELIGQGVGNLAAFLGGGMPGAGTMGPTLVNVAGGGRTFRSGILEGAFVIVTVLILGRWIAWAPIGALAGILLVVAWRMFDWTMFRLLRHASTRLDFAVIAAVILTAVFVGLIAASGVGVGLAILLFVRDLVKGSVIRRKLTLREVSSKSRRLDEERALLGKYGEEAVLCELQGNLFFGTTDQLFTQLEADLRARRFLLFDMRRVQSMDYTAAHLFEQMEARLRRRGGHLLFSGMPSAAPTRQDIQRYLAQLGLVRGEHGVQIYGTMDEALEWMEERILESHDMDRGREERCLELNEIDLLREFQRNKLDLLRKCIREVSVAQGEKVFSQGDPGDEVFLIRRGGVRILLPLPGGKVHHLATFGQGDFFGELNFLDRGSRSAHAEAKVPTDLYALSRSCFDERVLQDALLGTLVFARLARALSVRLRQTDAELRAVEDR